MHVADMAVTLDGLTWDDFEAIVQMKGDRRSPRLLYSEGSLTLVGASPHQGESYDDISEMAVTLDDLSWEDFSKFVTLIGDRSGPRIRYQQGSLTLVSPSQPHERCADRLDHVVKTVCMELRIVYQATGSTLMRRDDLEHGIMGDKTYYIAHEPQVRGKVEVDLNVDPPPDLAIEVEITNPAAGAIATWQNLGAPELWVYYGRRGALSILHLNDQGRYVEATSSRAFPFLTTAEVRDWVAQELPEPGGEWERRFSEWVRNELARRRGPAQG